MVFSPSILCGNGTQLQGIILAFMRRFSPVLNFIVVTTDTDCEAAQRKEERKMLSALLLQPHPRTGATPLHVGVAKGYIRVMSMLVKVEAS